MQFLIAQQIAVATEKIYLDLNEIYVNVNLNIAQN